MKKVRNGAKSAAMKQAKRILMLLLPVVGVVCILLPEQVTQVLPILLGGVMLLTGVIRMAGYLRARAYLKADSLTCGQNVILVVMGVAFLVMGEGSIGLMGTTWGLLGLRKAAETVDEALRRSCRKQHALLLWLEALVRLVLALALLFDPFAKFSGHIVLLGVELILVNVRLPQESRSSAADSV